MNITCKYQLVAVLLLLAHISIAKEGAKPVPATTTQFIHNAGQVTDQHGKLRSDVDFKIEHAGVTMFGGDGQLHYQWQRQIPNKGSVESEPTPTSRQSGTGSPKGNNILKDTKEYEMWA